MSERMPVIFVRTWKPDERAVPKIIYEGLGGLGSALPRPRAILSVSAHWYLPGTAVTAMAVPRTIHDFGGFPAELFAVRYAAPGDPALAREVQHLLPVAVELDDQWGLDHGTWSVLRHMYPAADIPVLQLSIDEIQPPEFHYRMGRVAGTAGFRRADTRQRGHRAQPAYLCVGPKDPRNRSTGPCVLKHGCASCSARANMHL